jgi:hypothetical protein
MSVAKSGRPVSTAGWRVSSHLLSAPCVLGCGVCRDVTALAEQSVTESLMNGQNKDRSLKRIWSESCSLVIVSNFIFLSPGVLSTSVLRLLALLSDVLPPISNMPYFTMLSLICGLFEDSVSGNDRPPLWSSGQSSWLQIQRLEFDSRCYQIF